MVLGGQDVEMDNTPEQTFEERLTDEDKKLLKGMRITTDEA